MAEMIPLIRLAIEENGVAELTVTGNSMLPLLQDRVSVVKLGQPKALRVGDIVLFWRSDGHYVLHRIAAIHGGTYDIVGDHQRVPDRGIPAGDIVAKVVAFNRRGKGWRTDAPLYRVLLPAIKLSYAGGRRIKRILRRIIK